MMHLKEKKAIKSYISLVIPAIITEYQTGWFINNQYLLLKVLEEQLEITAPVESVSGESPSSLETAVILL